MVVVEANTATEAVAKARKKRPNDDGAMLVGADTNHVVWWDGVRSYPKPRKLVGDDLEALNQKDNHFNVMIFDNDNGVPYEDYEPSWYLRRLPNTQKQNGE
jgi:hypothetical protein